MQDAWLPDDGCNSSNSTSADAGIAMRIARADAIITAAAKYQQKNLKSDCFPLAAAP
jgi:hypothetical protein